MNLTRLERMLRLIGQLQTEAGPTANALARDCGVSRRTIFRDLETLREAGFPLAFDDESQRYRVNGHCFLPPTNFTADEALAMIVLCHQLGGGDRVPFYSAARSAAMKLESSLPSGMRAYLGDVARAIQVRLAPTNPLVGRGEVYDQLVAALARRRAVRVRYDSLTEWEAISTRICPYRLLFSRHSWYVIGRSSLHRATRTFNVGRILELETLAEAYRIPSGFNLDRYLRNAWHLIPEPGPDREIVVRFKPRVAQNVAEVCWHKTQRTTWNDDGTLDYQATISGLNEISWWILGYGDQAEVLSPPELRTLIASRVQRMARQYGVEGNETGVAGPKRSVASVGG